MKRVLLILSAVLLVLSCNKMDKLKVVDLAQLTADYVAQDGEVLTGILGGNYKISLADGATVTLRNAVIHGVNDENCPCAGITAGNATLVLEATNIVKGFRWDYPGIQVAEGKTLTIRGDGRLDVSSNGYGAGIGGGYGNGINCGNIVIEGGVIKAVGGSAASGIGSAFESTCGGITISGGTVEAVGGEGAAGIGSGDFGGVGNITITTGVTQVTAEKGEWEEGDDPTPYSIGPGRNCTGSGTVSVGGAEGPVSESPFVYKP